MEGTTIHVHESIMCNSSLLLLRLVASAKLLKQEAGYCQSICNPRSEQELLNEYLTATNKFTRGAIPSQYLFQAAASLCPFFLQEQSLELSVTLNFRPFLNSDSTPITVCLPHRIIAISCRPLSTHTMTTPFEA